MKNRFLSAFIFIIVCTFFSFVFSCTNAVTPDVASVPDNQSCGGEIRTFADNLSANNEIHVATTGTDSATCGAAGNPCKTIGHAVGLATPGTAIIVHAGTYAGDIYISQLEGTDSAPIWIGGAAGEARPLIQGGNNLIQLTEARYVIVHDLEGEGATSDGINADDGGNYDDPDTSRYLVFRDLYIHDIGGTGNQYGLKLSGIDDYCILDCEFARCGGNNSGGAIVQIGSHHGVIARSEFHSLANSQTAIQCKGGSEDIEIRANLFTGAGERGVNIGGATGDSFFRPSLSTTNPNFEAKDIRVIANIFNGWDTSIAYAGCVECSVTNNTIVEPNEYIARILQENQSHGSYTFLACGDSSFINNIVYFDSSTLSDFVNIGAGTAPNSFTFSNNLWYAYDDPANSDPSAGLPVTETGSVIGQDPVFEDTAAGDYHLTSGSPAIKAGIDAASLSADYDFSCYSSPPSIGAFERP